MNHENYYRILCYNINIVKKLMKQDIYKNNAFATKYNIILYILMSEKINIDIKDFLDILIEQNIYYRFKYKDILNEYLKNLLIYDDIESSSIIRLFNKYSNPSNIDFEKEIFDEFSRNLRSYEAKRLLKDKPILS